jgi:hypothetical protein
MIDGYTKPTQKIKVFTILVTHGQTGQVIIMKPFTDLIKASRFHDYADTWYGDKHKVEFSTATK